MNRFAFTLFLAFSTLFSLSIARAQQGDVPKLIWKVNRINIGTVLEEEGLQQAEFEFTHTQDSLFFIEEVIPECGCTAVEYTQDTLQVGESGKVTVSFDPTSSAGFFSKLIVVRGNLSGIQDSLYLEGISIPYPSDLQRAYPILRGPLGFRLRKVNMGDVFDNEPKIKYVEFFNRGEALLDKGALRSVTPPHIQISQVQQFVRPKERGLLMVRYDGKLKNDLGFFEDIVPIRWENVPSSEVKLEIIADLFQYFAPIQKSDLNQVPQLVIAQKEVDLKEISSKAVVRRSVTLTNQGRQTLEIRKVEGNCECLVLEAPKASLEPGESMELSIVFDPAGRKGIDQRNIYVFSNDPVNPVQLIVVKSRIE
ncbi:DUF1573 domain-containing protein [Algoriphagus sp. H41]|uniref:DUF1573 domain-containing protein n=1 Tax=Algoriphagus oliviformis TaxID=2811231 RepID=A0ABS3C4R5_9BACT|nr:DUF1573 domain-containing protein [Algoriphagus oliviformis]MBN7811937.1 DUF1573 domain-containing protein [Algoriphagus oliviformis]